MQPGKTTWNANLGFGEEKLEFVLKHETLCDILSIARKVIKVKWATCFWYGTSSSFKDYLASAPLNI
jgi:hypothetical protein